MAKYLLAAVCTMILAGAANADFYVDQDTTTKKCTVVETKPDGTPPESDATMMVSDQTYKSKEEAEAAMKAMTECQ